MEKKENENRKENSRTALDCKLRVFKARLRLSLTRMYFVKVWCSQPRSQGHFPGLRAGWEKTLASAGHVSTLHPENLGVIN